MSNLICHKQHTQTQTQSVRSCSCSVCEYRVGAVGDTSADSCLVSSMTNQLNNAIRGNRSERCDSRNTAHRTVRCDGTSCLVSLSQCSQPEGEPPPMA